MPDLLHCHLDPSNHLDAACLALSDSALWGQARLGEFLPDSRRKFSPRYFPVSKTARENGEDMFLAKQSGISDPIASLNLHLALNSPHTSAHLFAYRDSNGILIPLTKRKFLARCNSVW
ncbi:hypothetical protein BDR03DRAFT_1017075 [Suillus americanus]|nr:hypothetical protein BDR03DRAFT_1017075 [Suillus americanus]